MLYFVGKTIKLWPGSDIDDSWKLSWDSTTRNQRTLDILSRPQKPCWWCRMSEGRHPNVAFETRRPWVDEIVAEAGQDNHQP